MSIRCINRNIDEVKNIANITGLNDSVIATMIGAWQENNNTEKFPTAQELGFEVNDVTVINKKIMPELDNKLINILDKLGVDVRVHDSLVYNGKDINGSFDTLSKIVDISLNRNLDTLSEETAHAVVSYLKASRNPLYSSMMSDISKFSIYQEVYNTYKDIYQNDINKIKEEAVAKAISYYIVKLGTVNDNNYLEAINKDTTNPKLMDRITSWFDKVINNFKKLLNNFGISTVKQFNDYFEQTAFDTLNNVYKDKNWKINDGVYLQTSNLPANIQNALNLLKEDRENIEIRKFEGSAKDIQERYFDKKTNTWIKNRVSDFVKKSKSIEDIKTPERIAHEASSASFGTLIHDDMRKAFANSTEPFNTIHGSKLKFFVTNFRKQFNEDSLFLTEQIISDGKVAGTIDLLVIEPVTVNGKKVYKTHIFDWKLIGGLDNPSFSIENRKNDYSIQLSNYIKILKEKYGLDVIGQSRMIPINAVYNKYGGDKQLTNIEIGNNKLNSDSSYLNPIPLLEENTDDKNINSLLSFLRNQLKNETSKDRQLAIKENIANLQISKDLESINDFIDGEGDRITNLLDKSEKTELTNTELLELINLMDYYKNIIHKNSAVSESLGRTSSIAQGEYHKLENLIRNHVFEIKFNDEIVDKGKLDFDTPIKETGFFDKFKQLSHFDIPAFQQLYKIIRAGKGEVESKVKNVENQLASIYEQIKSEEGDLQKGFDKIVNKKTGNLISKLNGKWYDDFKSKKIDSKLFDKDAYSVFEKELMKKFLEREPNASDKTLERKKATYNVYYGSGNKYSKFWKYDSPEFRPYLSDGYKELKDKPNSGIAKLYNLYEEINKTASKSTEYNVPHNYLPYITKSMVRQLLTNNVNKVWDNALDSISLHEWDNYELDSNGNKIYKIPLRYYAKHKDVALQSYNLGINLLTWANSVYTNEYLTEAESTIKLLQYALSRNKQIITKNGKALLTNNGELNTKEVEADTLEKFSDYIKQEVYNVESEDDVSIFGKSGKKIIKKILSYTSGNTLMGNILSALGNVTGGFGNVIAIGAKNNAFTNKQIGKAVTMFTSGDPKLRAIIAKLDVDNNTYDINKYKGYSADKLSNLLSWDNVFLLNKLGDVGIQNTTLVAMMLNHTVKDGKVIKKTESDKNLIELSEIKDGNLILPTDDYNMFLFRDRVKSINSEILGTTSDYNKSLIGNTLYGAMLLQFRRWILPMAVSRFGKLDYNVSTEQFDIGRYRSSFNLLMNNKFLSLTKELISSGDTSNLDKKLNQLYKQQLLINPNLSYEEFKDIYIRNIKSTVTELTVFLAVAALLSFIKGDDDDEKTVGQRLASKVLGRTSNELSFWYNPISFTSIIKTPIPMINPLIDMLNLFKNIAFLPFDLGDDEAFEKDVERIGNKATDLTIGLNTYSNLIKLMNDD